ncbi:unnamed protein product [Fusarium venenatum]|uniref:Uncharacterized protein n=1 Tax=Fusarium venenatum TaxID=56646 RepID=A0A2L2TH53_9HYPO|nr:uncharacterized protein FVRRES_12348 [Fusarium venenatum]CEI39657.1 unnamed protein product [Fusarium venenatum]
MSKGIANVGDEHLLTDGASSTTVGVAAAAAKVGNILGAGGRRSRSLLVLASVALLKVVELDASVARSEGELVKSRAVKLALRAVVLEGEGLAALTGVEVIEGGICLAKGAHFALRIIDVQVVHRSGVKFAIPRIILVREGAADLLSVFLTDIVSALDSTFVGALNHSVSGNGGAILRSALDGARLNRSAVDGGVSSSTASSSGGGSLSSSDDSLSSLSTSSSLGGLSTGGSLGSLSTGGSLGGLGASSSLGSLSTGGSLSTRGSAGLLSTCEAKLKIVELASVRTLTGSPAELLDDCLVEGASTSLDRERLATESLAAGVATLRPVYTSRGSSNDLVSTVGSNALLATVDRLNLVRSVLGASSLGGGGGRSLCSRSTSLGSGCNSSNCARGCDARQSYVGGSDGPGLAVAGIGHGNSQGSQEGRDDLCGRHFGMRGY